MIKILIQCTFFLIVAVLPVTAQLNNLVNTLDRYNVVWSSQSSHSAASMPCGGGDIGLNVWVEKGDILLYLSQSGMFDENNQMLKAGRVRLQLSANPFGGTDFRQVLRLAEGSVQISGGGTMVTIWVDIFRPVIHMDVRAAVPVTVTASYESWRHEDHIIQGTEFRANSYKVPQQKNILTVKDSIEFKANAVLFYHRNRVDIENIFDYTVRMEGMQTVKDQMFDPLSNNTFGGSMHGVGMRPAGNDTGIYANAAYKSWRLISNRPVRNQQIEIDLFTAQTKTLADWKAGLDAVATDAVDNKKTALFKSRQWWKQFWNRSYIFIEGADSFISRNYQLFRYMLGCNTYGQWPTKFNGGLFTFDPVHVDTKYSYSPDFRLWGGGTMTAQNQRLVYFPMIKSGDFDMMKPQFDFYLNAQTNAELRSKVYWKHAGACFTEQVENFGLPNVMEYGLNRPAGTDPGMEYNAWLEYEWETVFEFCLMMLEMERYEGRDIRIYIPFIESCLSFYDAHYQQLARNRGVKAFDEKGQYIFYPSSAAETFKMTYNSTTVIAALKVILGRLLELPKQYLDSAQRVKWNTMLKRVPPIPLRTIEGYTVLAPAEAWARVQNSETPQLYPVYPWGIYGVGKPGLDTAINTYKYDPHSVQFRSHIGWRQYSIFAARLGLTEEATILTREKFKNGEHRFPAFWGPGFDWTPDHNWGGAAMIGLQEMLMQVDGKKIYLLPAWPKAWNASFKLHAPYSTTVEATVKDGKIVYLQVQPSARKDDIIIMQPD
ncbi:MAG: DUF5703 domain-containing protein [Chitinophagaceae bacterium]